MGAQKGEVGGRTRGGVGVGERAQPGHTHPHGLVGTAPSVVLRKLLQCLGASKAAPRPRLDLGCLDGHRRMGDRQEGPEETPRCLARRLGAGANGGQTSRLRKANGGGCDHRGCPCKPSILPMASRS